jgi:hypothetical protein
MDHSLPNFTAKIQNGTTMHIKYILVYNPSKTREETWPKFTILSLHVPSFNFCICIYTGIILSLEGTLTQITLISNSFTGQDSNAANTNFAFFQGVVYTKEEESLDWFSSEPDQ